MFSDKKGQNQNPLTSAPRSKKVMGNGSVNANTGRKGTFEGTQKKSNNLKTIKKSSRTAPSNSFGKATQIMPGKMNFSKGAPGHDRGVVR